MDRRHLLKDLHLHVMEAWNDGRFCYICGASLMWRTGVEKVRLRENRSLEFCCISLTWSGRVHAPTSLHHALNFISIIGT